ARGDDEVERILVAATPPTPSSPSPSGDEPTTAWAPLGWSLLAVGTGGLITLGVAGGIGLARQADLKDRCGGTTCPAELQADVDRFEDAKLAATIGFVIGLSGTVLAVPPLVIAATESDDGEVALRLGPGSFSLQGRF
ncbi:MAG: hypothetical protein KC731_24130, partial [Myxococcales bacterium]|nr:hypothetical protein [Myxococcales bacterium]